MKRDMDIVRQIVLTLRNSDKSISSIPNIAEDVFIEHAQEIIEAGLAEGKIHPSGRKQGTDFVTLFRLTWAGQDFADSIIEDTVWNKVKENILKPSASWSFEILIESLKSELKRRIGL